MTHGLMQKKQSNGELSQEFCNDLKAIILNISKSLKNGFINSGGCICFAYYMSLYLEKCDIKHDIIAIDYDYELASADNFCEIGANHVMIYIDGIGYIDSNKILVTRNHVLTYSNILVIDKTNLKKALDNKDIWNPTYDRRYNSTISRVLNKNFKPYLDGNSRI